LLLVHIIDHNHVIILTIAMAAQHLPANPPAMAAHNVIVTTEGAAE
jgi:hypothetical protein